VTGTRFLRAPTIPTKREKKFWSKRRLGEGEIHGEGWLTDNYHKTETSKKKKQIQIISQET
jgi:hypothetical protein